MGYIWIRVNGKLDEISSEIVTSIKFCAAKSEIEFLLQYIGHWCIAQLSVINENLGHKVTGKNKQLFH